MCVWLYVNLHCHKTKAVLSACVFLYVCILVHVCVRVHVRVLYYT